MSGFLNNLSGVLGGTGGETKQFPRFNQQGQDVLNKSLGIASSGLDKFNQNNSFEPIANQARQNFQSKTIPSILERFNAQGGGGIRSSGLQGALGGAASGLETNLAALQSQFGQGQNSQLMQLLSQALTPQFDSAYFQRSPGLFESAGAGGLEGLSALLPLLKQLQGGEQGQKQGNMAEGNYEDMFGQPQQQQGQQQQQGGNWRSGLNTTGNVISALSPLLGFIPGAGTAGAVGGTAIGQLLKLLSGIGAGNNTPAKDTGNQRYANNNEVEDILA